MMIIAAVLFSMFVLCMIDLITDLISNWDRIALAMTSESRKILASMAKDECPVVRMAVASNMNASSQTRLSMKKDRNWLVQHVARH